MKSQKLTKKIIQEAMLSLIHDTMEQRVVAAYTALSDEMVEVVKQVHDFLNINNEQYVQGLGDLIHWTEGVKLTNLLKVDSSFGVNSICTDDKVEKSFSDLLNLNKANWSAYVHVQLPFQVPSSLVRVLNDTINWCRTCRKDDYEPNERDVVCISILRDVVNEGRFLYLRELGETLEKAFNDGTKIKTTLENKIGNKLARTSVEKEVPELAPYIANLVSDEVEPETDISNLLACMRTGEDCS